MSNQVYSNEITRYRGSRGYNKYFMEAGQSIPGVTNNASVAQRLLIAGTVYNGESTIQDVLVVANGSNMRVLSDGFYSIVYSLVLDTNNPAGVNVNGEGALFIKRADLPPGTPELYVSGFRVNNAGTDETKYIATLVWVGYLNANDEFFVEVTNHDPVQGNRLNIVEINSFFVISKAF